MSDQAAVDQIGAETAQASANQQRSDIEARDGGGINPRIAAAQLQSIQQQTAAAIGKGFQFTPEQIEAQLVHASRQLADLNHDRTMAQGAEQAVHSPAPDLASVAQADAVRRMMANTRNVIESHIGYLTAWQTSLNQAKANYLTTERVTEAQWQRLAKGLGG